MQARRIARELALLSINQFPTQQEQHQAQDLQNALIAAIRTLRTEVEEALETAAVELNRGSDRLLESETRAVDLRSAKAMITEAMELTQSAVNRLGMAVELPEFIQLADQKAVRSYALEIINRINSDRATINQLLTDSLVDWQLSRLAQIDRSILQIAVAEMLFFEVPDQVAINEAIELAKRYSGDEAHRFINGVLRRVTNRMKTQSQAN